MKKIMNVIAVFFIAIVLVGCGSSSSLTSVKIADINKKLEAKDTFVVVVSSSTCAACKDYAPVVSEFAQKNEKIDIIDTKIDSVKKDDKEGNEQLTKFVNTYSVSATPTTLFFKEGKISGYKTAALSENELEELTAKYLK